VVTRGVLAEQSSGSQSEKPFLKLGTVNPALPLEMSCFANYRICPALLAPRHTEHRTQNLKIYFNLFFPKPLGLAHGCHECGKYSRN
jgi:hypothetical protein